AYYCDLELMQKLEYISRKRKGCFSGLNIGGKMLKSKKYTTLDFIIVPLKILPVPTIYTILITILNSFIPA
ncbi:MAG: hypothetical protein E6Z15_12110, partial [Paenibacillus macerans]|nr:hypothetical protein [Paenibacillus macerans]